MKTRIISALVMLPLLAVLYFGGIWLVGAALLISVIGVKEFFDGFNACDIRPSRKIAIAMAIILYAGYLTLGNVSDFVGVWLVASVMASLVYGWDIKSRGISDSIATLTGIVYVVLFPYFIVLIDASRYKHLTWLVLIAAFGADIMAYFSGMAFGKHKMAPNLSPKKTIEGAVGGIVGSAVVCGLFGYFAAPHLFIHSVIIGLAGAPVSMCGDLTASAYKRKMGIKDYGRLIPGHGGIMDRFDSILFTAPFVYYYIVLIMPYFK